MCRTNCSICHLNFRLFSYFQLVRCRSQIKFAPCLQHSVSSFRFHLALEEKNSTRSNASLISREKLLNFSSFFNTFNFIKFFFIFFTIVLYFYLFFYLNSIADLSSSRSTTEIRISRKICFSSLHVTRHKTKHVGALIKLLFTLVVARSFVH